MRLSSLRAFHRFPSLAEISSFEFVQFSLGKTEKNALCTFFLPFFQARCVDAVCLSLRRCIVSRPGDVLKMRFLWFPDWIPELQKYANIVDFEKLFEISIYFNDNGVSFWP